MFRGRPVFDDGHQVEVDHGEIHVDVLFDLVFRECAVAIEVAERAVDHVEDLLAHALLEDLLLRRGAHVEVVALHDHLRDLHHLLGNLLGHVDLVFHVVVVFLVSYQPLDVLRVVGIVVERGHGAQLVESVGQHALGVHVGEAQRANHLGHALAASVVFHGLHQGFRHFGVVYEVDPSEAHTLALPLLVGVVVDDGGHAAYHLSVFVSDVIFSLAKLERRVLVLVQRVHVVAEQVGGIIFVPLVKVVAELHKGFQVLARGHFLDFHSGHVVYQF